MKCSGTGPEYISTIDFPRTDMDMLFCFDGELKVIPKNCEQINVNGASFIGSFDQPYEVIFSSQFHFLHVHFKTNGIYPLTKIPLHILTNQDISLYELMGYSSAEVYEKMQTEEVDLEKIKILEEYLLAIYEQSNINFRLNHGIDLIQSQKGMISINDLNKKLNTNYKYLERWFKSNVGLSPKKFSSITRFKFILEEIEKLDQPNWMNITTNFGFHDQSHFIHSFQKYAGLTPEQYWTKVHMSNFYNERLK